MFAPLLLLTTLCADPTADARALVDAAGRSRAIGRIDEALEQLEKARSLDRSPQLLNNIGVVLQEIGRYADAARAFDLVIADPSAPEPLRTLDRERRAALEPLLKSAHVALAGEGAEAIIDGTQKVGPGREIPVEPGSRWIEQWSLDGTIAAVWAADLPAGRRTVLPIWVTPPSTRAPVGVVTFAVEARAEVTVDAVPLSRAFAAGNASLVLRPGKHHLVIRSGNKAPSFAAVDVIAGQSARAEIAAPQQTPPPVVAEKSAPVVRYALAGAGGAALIVASALLATAAGSRAEVYEARVDDGVVTGVTQVEADALASSARTLDIVAIVTGATGLGLLLVSALGLADE